MPEPLADRISDWQSVPPLERWEAAFAELDRALRKHPALRHLDPSARPTIWAGPDAVALCTPEARYDHEDPRWWEPITNPRAAAALMVNLVDGLRSAIREARKAARSPAPAPPAH